MVGSRRLTLARSCLGPTGTQARDRLVAAGVRPTDTRIQVLESMLDRRLPSTPEAVFQHLAPGTCNLNSIYRTLAELHQAKMLSRYRSSEGRVVYALDEACASVSLVCAQCGRSTPLNDPRVAECLRGALADAGFVFEPGSMSVTAGCQSCARMRDP